METECDPAVPKGGELMWHRDNDVARFVCPLNDHMKRELLSLLIERVCSVWNPLFAKCGPMAKHREFITFRQQWARETKHLLERQWKRRRQMQRISDPWSLERPHVGHAGKSNTSQRPKVREPRHTPSPSPSPKSRTLPRCNPVASATTRIIE